MNLEEIVYEITSMNIQVISFDLFDTLVCRPVLNVQDLFYLIGKKTEYGKNFYYMRRNAEESAAKNRKENIETITIEEIYKQMRFLYGLSEQEAEKLKKLELDTELTYILPRKTMVQVFHTLVERKKKIIITTDMYLPLSFIEKILKKNKIIGYEKIFVSCEYGKSKRSGNLYKEVISYYKNIDIIPSKILHIGDNREVDFKMAQQQGIKAFYCPSAINRMKSISALKPILDNIDNHLDNSFLIGVIANTLFDNPFENYNRDTITDSNWNHATTLMISPMLFIFCKWMLEDCISKKINKLYCVYRDGYLPEKIITILKQVYKEAINIEKIYLNRSILYCFYSQERNGFFNALKDIPIDKNMTIQDFINNRILIDPNYTSDFSEVFSILKKYGAETITDPIKKVDFENSPICTELEPYFKKNANNLIKAVDFYISNTITNNNFAVFDIGYRGRVGKFLNNRYHYNFTGYHLCAKSELQMANINGAQTKTLIQRGLDILRMSPLCYVLLDDLVSIQAPGMNKIIFNNKELNFVYERDVEFSLEIDTIQTKVIEFTSNMVEIFQDDLKLLHFDVFPFYDLYTRFLSNDISRKDVELFCQMRSPNDTCMIRTDNTNYYKDWYKQIVHNYKENKIKADSIKANENKAHNSKNNIYVKILNSDYRFILQSYYKSVRRLMETVNIKKPLSQYAFEQIFNIDEIIKNQVEISVKQMYELIKEEQVLEKRPITAFFGEIIENRGLSECIKAWDQYFSNNNFVYFRESIEKDLLPCCVCKVPDFLNRNNILMIREKKIKVSKSIKKIIDKNEYLQKAYYNLIQKFKNIPNEYMQLYVYWADQYIKKVLNILKPESVVIWLEFYPYHEIIKENCKKSGIKLFFYEFGLLPGTYCIEQQGQMGRSYPAINFKEFKEKKVTDQEVKYAEKVIEYINKADLKRWDDKNNNTLKDVMEKIKKGRPILLYAGQNDYESGICPYDENAKKNHSPIFSNSDDAAIYLSELAKKNDWNLIYKPHPSMVKLGEKIKIIPENLFVLEHGDINQVIDQVDLTITILSQVAYVSLIRNKPVVMLGYTQLRGKGCTYEAFRKESIESTIKKAILEKYTKKMFEEFKHHVAQLLKYYLYDDGSHNFLPYGINTETALNILQEKRYYQDADKEVALFNERREHGEKVWSELLKKYSLDPKIYTFLIFPSFNSELNNSTLNNINKIFTTDTKIVILANDKSILKNSYIYSQYIKKSIYIKKYDIQCLIDYYCTDNFHKNLYIVSLDTPYARSCNHIIGIKETSLNEMIINGIFGKGINEKEILNG